MFTKMKERLIEFLKKENKSSAQFAEEIGVQASGISHILSGRNNPSLDFVLRMLDKYPFISTEWLLFGKGSMYREARMQSLFDFSESEKPVTGNRQSDDTIKKVVSIQEVTPREGQDVSLPSEKISQSEVVKIVWFYGDNSFEEYFPKK
jgi:transcriptional regulator with XRE-family HTH domain